MQLIFCPFGSVCDDTDERYIETNTGVGVYKGSLRQQRARF